MIHSAHDILRVRICQAAACTEDADLGSPLCTRCARECRPKRTNAAPARPEALGGVLAAQPMKLSAHDLCRTRLCRGHLCANDAEPYQLVCATCESKRRAGRPWRIHETPEQLPATLRCSGCGQHKPDAEFPPKPEGERSGGGRKTDRRGRYCYCTECADPTAMQIREWRKARERQARKARA